MRYSFYSYYFKRLFDFVLSLGTLFLTLPVIIIIMIVLFMFNKGKVLFIQNRPGLHGETFKIIKFRTMNDRKNFEGELLPDSERITLIGRFIRSFSLDELPQLYNVLKGDMSLVGPRPLRIEYLELYTARQARRHEVRPGITGWAQINGRNTLSWKEKFEMDVWYVDNVSFKLDMKIIFLTILKTVKRDGINSFSSATMDRFIGTENGAN